MRVATAFGAARRYDEAADVQRAVAHDLARKIGLACDSPPGSILEIGAGTGFLTRALARELHAGRDHHPDRWIVSDIAPSMVERAQASGPASAEYHVIDGEAVDPALGAFDLICSSLAFQWFDAPARSVAALQAMLKPGGILAFATMAQDSFAEWHAVHRDEGVEAGTPLYPNADVLRAMATDGIRADVEVIAVPQPEPDARAFLHRLKAIGAATPRAGHVPLDAGRLRRVMRRFDAGDHIVTYRIAFCLFHAPPAR